MSRIHENSRFDIQKEGYYRVPSLSSSHGGGGFYQDHSLRGGSRDPQMIDYRHRDRRDDRHRGMIPPHPRSTSTFPIPYQKKKNNKYDRYDGDKFARQENYRDEQRQRFFLLSIFLVRLSQKKLMLFLYFVFFLHSGFNTVPPRFRPPPPPIIPPPPPGEPPRMKRFLFSVKIFGRSSRFGSRLWVVPEKKI